MTSTEFTDARTAAKVYLEHGWYSVPIPSREKGPRGMGWQKLRLTAEEIPPAFAVGCNNGLLLGAPSGNLTDLDLDVPAAVTLSRAWAPTTRMVHGRTSRPGSHRWSQATGPVEYLKLVDPEPPGTTLLEVRNDRKQTLVPPSVHPDGEPLAWEGPLEPGSVHPEDLHRAARRIAAGALLCDRWSKTSHAGDPVGHTAGLALAGFFLRRWSLDATLDFLGGVAEAAGADRRKIEADIRDTRKRLENGSRVTGGHRLMDHLSPKVISKLCEWLELDSHEPAEPLISAGGQPAAAPAPELLTDMFNARLFARQHSDDVRYVYDAKSWYVFDGRRWTPDPSGEVERRAKLTVESLYPLADQESGEDRRKEIRRHAVKSQDGYRLASLLKLARSEDAIKATRVDFDRDHWLLTCQNGTIDLRSGTLRPHDRADRITRLAPVEFKPEATAPMFDAFLAQIMDKKPALVSYLQRALGYSATGDTREHRMFVAHGSGANGKSTLLRAVKRALGSYALTTPVDTLVAKRHGGGIPNDVARLAGARFVCAVEAEEDQRLAEEKVKQMTGGDDVAARFLNQEFFEFTPTFKLWLATNHRPHVRGTDEAIWRRIDLIPFAVTIPEHARDTELEEKLASELPGILAWIVAGCLRWQKEGLCSPREVRDATDEYRREEDVLGPFIEERCYLDPSARVGSTDLYAAYRRHCDKTGEKYPLSQKKLAPKLRERGMTALRDVAGRVQWAGIGLQPGAES